MGFFDSLKEAYLGLEDKFYGFIDSIDKNGSHLGKLVDVLDSSGLRAFPVFVLLILVGAYFLLGPTLPGLSLGQGTLTIAVQSNEGIALKGAAVSVTLPEGEQLLKDTGENGTAEFKVPLNKELEIEISKIDYKIKKEKFTATKSESEKLFSLERELGTITKTINLLSANTNELIPDPVTVNFSCSDTEFETTKTVSGSINLDLPENCGKLYTDIQGNFKTETGSIDLSTGESATLFLAAKEVGSGNVTVSVFDAQNNPLLGINVTLAAENNSPFSTKTTAASGSVSFKEVPSGKYYVRLFDPSGTYAEYDSSTFDGIKEVAPNSSVSFTAKLDKKSVGKIALHVTDAATGLAVENALVSLLKGETVLVTDYSNAEGAVQFPVGEDVPYNVSIDKEGYLLALLENVFRGDKVNEVALQEATVANSQSLTVTVLDEKNKPVENARVSLKRNEDGTPFGGEFATGANGQAVFNRVEEGMYYAHVYKPGFGEKTSKPLTLSKKEKNEVTVILPIGSGSIQVKVLNEERQPVPGAKVSIRDAYAKDQLDEKIVDTDGVKELVVRADKTVFLNISHADYLPYNTVPIQIAKDVSQPLEVSLAKNIPSLSVELLGLFLNGERVRESLNPGQKYNARLQLRVPKNSTFEQAGIHFRTGSDDSQIVERDGLFIRDIASAAQKVKRGTTWNPYNGFATDIGHLTTGNSKWIETVFENPSEGIFEADAVVQVRETVPLGTPLELHYRGWGKTGGYVRFPQDALLGTSEVVGDRHALYANTKLLPLSAGPSNLCEDAFCYIFNVQDKSSGLQTAIIDEFPAQISGGYKFTFIMASISDRLYPNAKLEIKNSSSSLDFENYSIVDVRGQEKKSSKAGSEFSVSVGTVSRDDSIFGNLEFKTKKEGLTEFTLSLITEEGTKVFEKVVRVDVRPAAKMEVNVLPRMIVPFITNNLLVQVTDFNGVNTLSDATVIIKKDDFEIVTGKTNAEGVFPYALAAPLPGTKVRLVVEKSGFRAVEMELTVTENILSATPFTLSQLLTIGSKPSSEQTVVLSNLTEIPLFITDIKSSGFFDEFVKLKFKQDYKGSALEVNQGLDLEMSLELTEKGVNVNEPKKFDGSLDIVLSNAGFGKSWVTRIPMEVRIGFGDSIDESSCFGLFPNTLDVFAGNQVKEFNLVLRNDCKVQGNAIPLKNLTAKLLNQTSNDLGEYEVSTDISELGNVKLSNKAQVLAQNVPAESENTVTVKFKPDSTTTGQSKPTIIFEATHLTEGGEEKLNEKVKLNILINDLAECVELVGTENLTIDSLPTNFGYGNFQRQGYDPSQFGNEPRAYSGSYGTNPSVVPASGYPGSEQAYPEYGNRYAYPNQNYRYPGYDQSYTDPNYTSAFSPAGYPQGSFGGTGTASKQFLIKNNCVSPVEIQLTPSSGLILKESSLTIDPNSETKVNVESAYLVGKQNIDVKARVSGSRQATTNIKSIPVTVENKFTLGYQDCISIDPAGTLEFNDLFNRPTTLTVKNTCFDEGVILQPTTNTIMFSSRDLIQDWRVLGNGSLTQGPDGKTIQELQFEIVKKLGDTDLKKVPLAPESAGTQLGSALGALGQLRRFLAGGYYRVEARTSLIVNFITRYGTRSSSNFAITIQDLYEAAPFVARLSNTGDPSYSPEQCVKKETNLLDLKALYSTEPDKCIPADQFEGLFYYTYNTENRGGLFRLATQSKEGWTGGCGTEDSFSIRSGDRKEVDGAVFDFTGNGKDIELNIDLSRWNGKRIDLKHNLLLDVTRVNPLKQGEVTLPVSLCINKRDEDITPESVLETQACQGGGETGSPALEKYGFDKLLFDWEWDSVSQETCNADKQGYYCDSTQFAIALNKKAKLLKQTFGDILSIECKDPSCVLSTEQLHRYLYETKEVDGSYFFVGADGEFLKNEELDLSLNPALAEKVLGIENVNPTDNANNTKLIEAVYAKTGTKSIMDLLKEIKEGTTTSLNAEEKDKLKQILVKVDLKDKTSHSQYPNLTTNLTTAGASKLADNLYYLDLNNYAELRKKYDTTGTPPAVAATSTLVQEADLLQKVSTPFVGIMSRALMNKHEFDTLVDNGKIKDRYSGKLAQAGYSNYKELYKDLINFTANLMENTYFSEDFVNDFTRAYTKHSPLKLGQIAPNKFTPGTYAAELSYALAEENAPVAVTTLQVSELTSEKLNNPLLLLPVNGNLGKEDKTRYDYGLTYNVDPAAASGQGFFFAYNDLTGEGTGAVEGIKKSTSFGGKVLGVVTAVSGTAVKGAKWVGKTALKVGIISALASFGTVLLLPAGLVQKVTGHAPSAWDAYIAGYKVAWNLDQQFPQAPAQTPTPKSPPAKTVNVAYFRFGQEGKLGEKVLKITPNEIVFTPSNAMPLKATISKTSDQLLNPVGLIYNAGIGVEAEATQESLLDWVVSEDEIAGQGSGAVLRDVVKEVSYLCSGAGENQHYAVLFDKLSGKGKLVLKTVAFTPVKNGEFVSGNSLMTLYCGKDNVVVQTPEMTKSINSEKQSQFWLFKKELNKDNLLASEYNLKKILDRVKSGDMCVKVANDKSATFYWNKDQLMRNLP